MTSPSARFAELAGLLGTLASPARLELLHQLRSARTLGEIRLSPQLSRGDERPERPLTRQAISHHLHQLHERGLVQRVSDGGRGDAYVLDHARLFALVDDVRGLTKLRPVLPTLDQDPARTVERPPTPPSLPSGPRLMVAYGREDAQAFSLQGGSIWRIGRSAACEIRLDYDPYVSAEHAVIEREGEDLLLTDLGSTNGTWLDWSRLARNERTRLRAGSLLTVGRSVLVLQL